MTYGNAKRPVVEPPKLPRPRVNVPTRLLPRKVLELAKTKKES